MPDDPRLQAGFSLLGHRLRDIRVAAGMTLPQTSAVCGASVSQLSDVERGRTRPMLPLLLRLADAYGTTVARLLEDVYPFGTSVAPRTVPGPPPDGRRRPEN